MSAERVVFYRLVTAGGLAYADRMLSKNSARITVASNEGRLENVNPSSS